MDETFFTGYRRNVLLPDDVLVAIHLPFTTPNQFFVALKQAKRRDDDIAIVNIAVNVRLADDPKHTIEALDVAFGGMAPTTVLAVKTTANVLGSSWDQKTLEEVHEGLFEEIQLADDVPGGMASYRRTLMLSLFFKAYLAICKEVQPLEENQLSGTNGLVVPVPESTQFFKVPQGLLLILWI